MNVIEIRYFAAAAEAAGTTHEHLEVAPGTTLAALREALAGRGTQMARVIGLSSYRRCAAWWRAAPRRRA